MNKIEFSVIIPVFNQEKYIKKCIESVLLQNFDGNFEIIAIDDGSKDNSAKILEEFKDDKLKIFKNENSGVSYTRNFGLNMAQGKYIVFLDSDDYLEYDALKNFQAEFNDEPDIILAPFYMLREHKNDIKLCYPLNTKLNEKLHNLKNLNINNTNGEILDVNPELCTKAYKKDFLIQNNIYFQNFKLAEDLPFFYKTMIFAKSVDIIENPVYYYRKGHKETIGKDQSDAVFEIINAISEGDKIIKGYKNFHKIEKNYTKNTIKICLYWFKKIKCAQSKKIFYNFCTNHIKALKPSPMLWFRFYKGIFINNLVDILKNYY